MNSFLFQINSFRFFNFLPDFFGYCFLTLSILSVSAIAFGAEFSLYSRAGLFQQPSSQYYHFTQGIGVRLLFFDERVGVEVTYDQRPKFRSQGYEDQEEFTTINFGGSFKRFKNFRLTSFIGVSKIYGYIRSTHSDEIFEKREYEMHAASLSMRVEYVLKHFVSSFGIQNFHGFSTREQSEIYVAWPFYGFVFALGVSV